jgi:hypothetical protein
MLYHIYSIYDKAIKAYNRPFMVRHEVQALRDFRRVVNDEQSNIYGNPEDFCLHYVGTFDDQTAKFTQENHEKIEAINAKMEE